MKLKSVFFLFLLIFLSNGAEVFSQNPSPKRNLPPILDDGANHRLPEFFKVGDVTGNLGGAKAIYLAKPEYTDEAKNEGFEGKVRVEIEIDEDGNVVSAKAVSGAPSLYESARRAAFKSRFSAPTVNGQKTKAAGYLNYHFAIETPNWFAVAYALADFNFPPVRAAVIKKALQPDWTEENELIRQLSEIKRPDPKDLKPKIIVQSTGTTSAPNSSSSRLEARIEPPTPISYEAAGISQNLIAALQKRLANDPRSLWHFNLCLDLMRAVSSFRNPSDRANAALILRGTADSAPPDIAPETLAELKKVIALFEQQKGGGFRSVNGGAAFDLYREINKAFAFFASVRQ